MKRSAELWAIVRDGYVMDVSYYRKVVLDEFIANIRYSNDTRTRAAVWQQAKRWGYRLTKVTVTWDEPKRDGSDR